ncbi:MAG: aminopeptidase N C-terminal domain-containing protein [Alphaproteobacteria bacterium]|nr:aminopeptidase N C-terminal domain-containing protein [Alphaproteobacteria bacterium]
MPGYEDALSCLPTATPAAPLAMDKWFMVQPRRREETLAAVKTLTAHPGFSAAEPEPASGPDRRLCQREPEPVQPRRRREVSTLSPTSRWISTRATRRPRPVLSAFRSWRALEPGRRARARATL